MRGTKSSAIANVNLVASGIEMSMILRGTLHFVRGTKSSTVVHIDLVSR